MPRRSSASLGIVPLGKPTGPRRGQRRRTGGGPRVFSEIVRSAPAEHFKVGDAPLIQAYAEAICLARQSALELAATGPVVGGRTSPWIVCQEKAHRAISALSMRLRLSPQHRADSRSAGGGRTSRRLRSTR